MNKLILIKINVNMKQIESIKVGVGGEILSELLKLLVLNNSARYI